MHEKTLRLLVQEKGPETIASVEKELVERYRHHSLVSEADFIAGASCVIRFLGLEKDAKLLPAELVPPLWVFGVMGNRSVTADVLEKNGEIDEAEARRIGNKQWKAIYRRAYVDDAVGLLHTVVRTADNFKEMDLTRAEALDWLKEEAEAILDNMWETPYNEEEE